MDNTVIALESDAAYGYGIVVWKRKMDACRRQPEPSTFKFAMVFLALLLTSSARAYDHPLSAGAIRDAYTLGTREGGVPADFLARYGRRIAELRSGTCVSAVRVETPFLEVADYSSKAVNYSAQDAVKEFYGRPVVFRIYLDICYKLEAPPPNSVKVRVMQHKKEIVPVTDKRAPYGEPAESSYFPANGERVQLEFAPDRFDSSRLQIHIDTPDGQHAGAEFDLATLR